MSDTTRRMREQCELLHADAVDLLGSVNIGATSKYVRIVAHLFELLRSIVSAIEELEKEKHR